MMNRDRPAAGAPLPWPDPVALRPAPPLKSFAIPLIIDPFLMDHPPPAPIPNLQGPRPAPPAKQDPPQPADRDRPNGLSVTALRPAAGYAALRS